MYQTCINVVFCRKEKIIEYATVAQGHVYLFFVSSLYESGCPALTKGVMPSF